MRFLVTALSIVMLAACASTSAERPADIPPAEVSVALRAPLLFGSSRVAQAPLNVTVTSSATVPVKVRRIRLTSPAMMEYSIRPVASSFNDVLPPAGSKTFTLLTEAYASSAGLSPSEPLNVRAEVDFEVGERHYREVFNVVSGIAR